jgi:SAM-dependent methyltransferase
MAVYADAANPDLLERIPLSATSILEVGCGAGALGAEHKRRNPAARYFGIEADADVARIAQERLDEVAVLDVEQEPLPFGETSFDCIIYGDVLEHLRDPWALLTAHARCLNPGGTVLICIPNVEHWSFAERLLRGTFDYEEQGLFDRTHLRWFNLETTRRALLAAGLHPRDVTPRIFDQGRAVEFVRAMQPALANLGIDPAHYLGRATPLQYVWRATARPVEPLHVVSTMLAPVGGVSQVRVVEPLRAIGTDPSVTTRIVEGDDLGEAGGDTPRIFIFHRPLLAGEAGLAPVRRLLRQGYVVVCEFDDHPDYIPVLQRPDIQNFRAVHAVQTSTEPLAEVLRQQNPEVAVFPNAISRLPMVRNHATPERLTLFFGGLNREEDWPPLMPALNAVAAMAGERLHFQIVNDRGFFDALRTPHKSFTPLCDYATYQELLSRSDISFMPLNDTPFNRCKSDLKFLEAAAFRVTALASQVVYGNTIEDGNTGVVFHDAQDLQRRLLRLVANPEIGRSIGDAARAYVAKHRMLAYQTARRTAWYRSLWARRDALRQDLLMRAPELLQPAMSPS